MQRLLCTLRPLNSTHAGADPAPGLVRGWALSRPVALACKTGACAGMATAQPTRGRRLRHSTWPPSGTCQSSLCVRTITTVRLFAQSALQELLRQIAERAVLARRHGHSRLAGGQVVQVLHQGRLHARAQNRWHGRPGSHERAPALRCLRSRWTMAWMHRRRLPSMGRAAAHRACACRAWTTQRSTL